MNSYLGWLCVLAVLIWLLRKWRSNRQGEVNPPLDQDMEPSRYVAPAVPDHDFATTPTRQETTMNGRVNPVARPGEPMDEGMIRLDCHVCNKRYKLPPQAAGRRVVCKQCSTSMIVPTPTKKDTAMNARKYPVARLSQPMDEEMIHFNCPVCKKHLKGPPEAAGRRGVCKQCKTSIIVPTPAWAPAPVAPPARVMPAAEPTVPMNITIPKTGMGVGTTVTQKTADDIVKVTAGAAILAAGLALGAALLGVRPPRMS